MMSDYGRTPYVSYIPNQYKFEELISVVPFKKSFQYLLRNIRLLFGSYVILQDSISQNCCSSGRQAKLPSVAKLDA